MNILLDLNQLRYRDCNANEIKWKHINAAITYTMTHDVLYTTYREPSDNTVLIASRIAGKITAYDPDNHTCFCELDKSSVNYDTIASLVKECKSTKWSAAVSFTYNPQNHADLIVKYINILSPIQGGK